VRVDFVHLTGCAAFDRGRNEVAHVGPPVVLFDQVDGFGNSGVSCGKRIVKKVCYPPPKTVVFHDNESVVFVEVVVRAEGERVGGHSGNEGVVMGVLGNFNPIV
jgi:hypothetical protein